MSVTDSRIPANVFENDEDEHLHKPVEFDDVVKNVEPRVWQVEGDVLLRVGGQDTLEHRSYEYVQEPLSYNGIVQFTGLLSRKVQEVMSGENGVSLANIIEIASYFAPGEDGESPNVQEILGKALAEGATGLDTFVKGFLQLVAYVPDVLDEAQCIWLRVPFRDRMIVREIWSKPPGKGGLTRKEGTEMFNVFIAQNYEELEGFLLEEIRKIWAQIQRERKRIHQGA